MNAYEMLVEWYWEGKNRYIVERTCTFETSSATNPRWTDRDENWCSVVISRRLTARCMARTSLCLAKQTNTLKIHREIIIAYSGNYTRHINWPCGQDEEIINVRSVGTCDNHRVLKSLTWNSSPPVGTLGTESEIFNNKFFDFAVVMVNTHLKLTVFLGGGLSYGARKLN